MKITEKEMVHKALRCCRDGSSCSRCPYRSNDDCIEILEHLVTELYLAEHPEIFNRRIVKKDDKVEVVRCKDCISYNALDRYCEAHSKSSYDYSYYAGNDFYFYVDDEDYCSFAKREDE